MRHRTRVISVVVMLAAALALVPLATAEEKPQYGGVLTRFIYADPGRLDIHTETPFPVQIATAGIFSGLLHHDPADPAKITGDLAERWTGSADGKTYTFFLRKDVKWHDGEPFTVADVKATLDRLLHPDFRSPRCGAMLKPMVAGFNAVDRYTVEIRLNAPNSNFIPSIASAWCRIVAKHILEKHGDLSRPEAQIGTGPFRFKRYERGSVIEWEKNRDYFVPGVPYLDGVKHFILVSGPTQLAAAKAGRLMLWEAWPPLLRTQVDELQRTRGTEIEVFTAPVNTVAMVQLNTQKPPFNNRDLRRAVYLGIDRQEIITKAMDGSAMPCALLDPKVVGDFALPLEEIQKLPGCRQPKDQDIAEAKRLVEKHYPNGVDIEASIRSVTDYVDRAQLVVSQLRRIGIRATLKTYESAAGYSIYGKGDFTLIATQDTGMVTNDPSDVFMLLFRTGAGRNYGKWSDRKVDDLVEQGIREQNQDKRKQIYHELQRYLLTQDTPGVIVGWIEGAFFAEKRVRNYRPGPTVFDNNTFMKVWLAR